MKVLQIGVADAREPAKRLATHSRYLATLAKLHTDGHPDPTKDPAVLAQAGDTSPMADQGTFGRWQNANKFHLEPRKAHQCCSDTR